MTSKIDSQPLAGPVALVTGGARRIGKCIVETLHQAGYRIAIHCFHSVHEAEQLAERLNQQRSNSAAVFQADLNQPVYAELVAQSTQQWGRLDILINNASSFFPTPMVNTQKADWDDLLNTNLKAPYFLSQATIPQLKLNHGCIINIADIHGERPLKGYPVYSIAKAGLIMLTQALAKELAPEIRVNAVAPGITLLPEKDYDPVYIAQLQAKIPLKHFSSPQDIAEGVLFLIRQASITGQILKIDGGRSLQQ